MSSVHLRNVSKSYGTMTVIDDVSLEIGLGEFVVFVGQSGSGKSTLLRMIAGLEPISSGEVWINGRKVNDLAPAKRSIAMVFQSYALYPQMTVEANIGFGLKVARMAKETIRERTVAVAETLRLVPFLQRRPRALSGGQRQRVAIGRAIARKPAVFLFDEPLSNLDAALRGDMRVEIARLHDQLGVTSIYVTHDQVEAMTLADRIVVFEGGKIQQVGTPMDVYDRPANRFVAQFVGTPKMNFFRATPQLDDGQMTAVSLDCGALIPLARRHPAPDLPLTLGIRPEHLAPGPDRPGALAGTVRVIERLGAETYAYLDTASAQTFTVRLDPAQPLRIGDRLSLHPRTDSLHLFSGDGTALPR